MGIRGRRWLAATCLMLAAAACSGDDDDAGGATLITDPPRSTSTTERSTTTTTSTTIDPQADVKAEVEAAYLAYSEAWLQIFSEPNPENPLIDQHTTGAVREAILDAVSKDILEGRHVQPPEDPADLDTRVLSVDVSGDSATVEACEIDGTLLVDRSTGQVLNDEVATLHVRAEMVKAGDMWKLSESEILDEREGRWDCVAA